MSLEGFGLSEGCIRPVQVIQRSQHSVALVEPGNQTENKTSLEVTEAALPFLFPSPSSALRSRPCGFCCCTTLPRSPHEARVKLLLQLPSLPALREQPGGHAAVSACSRGHAELPGAQPRDASTAVPPGDHLSPAAIHVLARAELWRKRLTARTGTVVWCRPEFASAAVSVLWRASKSAAGGGQVSAWSPPGVR